MKTARTRWWTVMTTAVVPLLGACADSPEEEAPSPEALTADAPTLADVQAVGMPNTAMPLSNVVTAGQPTEEQLTALVDLGYIHFVSLSPSTAEGAGWEEGIAADAGIHFSRIPVEGAEGLTRENVLELDRVLNEVEEQDRATVVYAATTDEVGAMLALRAHWLEGADPAAALDLGLRVGLNGLQRSVQELLVAPR
jgi:hypothetical protein